MDTQLSFHNAMMLTLWTAIFIKPSFSKPPQRSYSHRLMCGWERPPVSMTVVLQIYQTHMWLDLCKGKVCRALSVDLVFLFLRWLDKLGIAAAVGHKRVFRQDFVGGNYALLDRNQNPLPVSYYTIVTTYNFVRLFQL